LNRIRKICTLPELLLLGGVLAQRKSHVAVELPEDPETMI
jgi:hypothetical protein